jgi:hypothetical protein
MHRIIRTAANPGDMVRLGCDRCGRSGRYRKQTLIAQYGPDILLPDLRHEIAKCERRGARTVVRTSRNARPQVAMRRIA